MLNRSIHYAINFPAVVKTGLATTACFKRTMALYMPRARQQSFYSTDFPCFRFQYNGLRYDLAPTAARFPLLLSLRENGFYKTRHRH